MSKAEDAFIKHKSRFAVSWALCNLQRLHGHASAMDAGKPLEGRTAIVVGAGPALRGNGHALKIAQDKGIAILCVNSSDGPLRALGVVPDVLVARESLDQGEDIAASQAPMVALDICAHPSLWDAAGDRLAWFIPGYPRHLGICRQLGVRPVFGGTAAANTAVMFAFEWGASRIILAGCDLALAPDGHAYHPDAARLHDLVAHVEQTPDGEVLAFTGWAENAALCERSGQKPQPEMQYFERTMAADWSGPLVTIPTWQDQRRWLEIQASRHGRRVDMINATEGGGGIGGWRLDTLEDALSREASVEPVRIPAIAPVSREANEAMIESLRAEARMLEALALQMLRGDGPDLRAIRDLRGFVTGAPLIESLGAWRAVDAPTNDPRRRCAWVYSAWLDAAREAQKILTARAAPPSAAEEAA